MFKKSLKLIIIHNNNNKKLIKIYKNKIYCIKNFKINKYFLIFFDIILLKIYKKIKKKFIKINVVNFLIWKSNHLKEIKIILKNFIKINKFFKISIFKSIGNLKILKKVIKKLV
ncbi:hypothetical protein NASALF_102 [Candidatus Nasuia deltocephalinicola str. NAS-ALF]|uniref:Uncharacterized protein n=1 Tax=Candidatus Nasuia deltocephalinicola str. NAS-ALF TaxID=1343077 RepID=S5SY83_9PROT|nr:hypothetical protein NASALF_102 [Candidatus Nasuia deltocephalinicola str. NAS-ALF]